MNPSIPFSDDISDHEVRCRQFVDLSPDAVLIHHNNRVVHANDELLLRFGASNREQVIGLSPFDLVHADAHSTLTEQNERAAVQRQRTPLSEIVIRRLDGACITMETLAVPVPHPDGSTAVMVVLREGPTRQRKFVNQQQVDVQFRNIIETAMDGIISMNEQQEIVLFNAAAEQIFGLSADQVLGQPIEALIPTRFRPGHRHDVEQFGRGMVQHRRMGSQRTVMALRGTGVEFPIEASISQTTVDGKKVYTAIVRDVTEAVRYRQQIEQQSQMLDQVSDAVSVVDLEGRIRFWNQAASRLFGWTAQEAIGQNAYELLYRGDAEVLRGMLQVANARHAWVGELTKASRSGKKIIVEHRRSVHQDDSGVLQGYLCIDIDITNRKKMERESRRSQRLESIGTLAGGIAHDLNNVLTPILMGANILASGRNVANPAGMLKTMVASAQRGADLIKQLLAFAGGLRGERSRVDLAQVVTETVNLLEHTLAKSIQFAAQVQADCPPVLGDATELSQILTNLCINARDAMPDGGTLSIEVSCTHLNGNASQLHPDAQAGPYVVLNVTDTGSGMSPEILDRIFDPFFTTKEIGKGTGLGLATVQGIAKSYGGFVMVYSESGKGSKFSVYLPALVSAEPTEKISDNEVTRSGNGGTILLVDDETSILDMTSVVLEAAGYQVRTAQDGAAAIALFARHRDEISAVLLDMMMPGIDGLHTLDQLRQIDPDVVVIASSGLRTTQRETEVLERGAKGFLPKPYYEDSLLQMLSDVLKSNS